MTDPEDALELTPERVDVRGPGTSDSDTLTDNSADPNAATMPCEPPAQGRACPTVPGYIIDGELGRGGMGVVYKAWQVRLHRAVALKMVLAGVHASPESLVRFLGEAEVYGRLEHPNIVRIHAVGDHDGCPYFEMEYAGGGSLKQRLLGDPWAYRDAAQLIETLARAIDAAHHEGVVHRDLKPANVLFTAQGVPKIVDFGLAKLVHADIQLTNTQLVMGSPSYMAPEQTVGGGRDVGPAADVYSLGTMLYELLTGRPPFKAADVLETITLVKTAEPVRPSRLQPGVPKDLETICLHCLHKNPARRYGTADELANDLRRFLVHEPIRARPLGWPGRLLRWCRRKPGLAAGLGLAALGLTAIAFATSFAAFVQRRAAVEAQDQAAELALNRGLLLGEQGQAARGLLWMVRSLELDPHRKPADELAARSNLTAWGSRTSPLVGHEALHVPPRRVSVSPDGERLVVTEANGVIRVVSIADGQEVGPPIALADTVVCTRISNDGRTLVTGGRNKRAELWNVADGKLLGVLEHPGTVLDVAFDAEGRRLLIGGSDGTARIWDVDLQKPIGEPMAHGGEVVAVAFNPVDASSVLTGCADGTARPWSARDGKPLASPLDHGGPLATVSFSPDGSTLLTLGRDGASQLWDGITGDRIGPLLRQNTPYPADSVEPETVAVFSPDSRFVAIGGRDGRVRIHDTGDGTMRGPPLAHEGPITALAIAPDGSTVLSGSRDGTARLWNLSETTMLGPPLEHGGHVLAVAFRADGDTVVTVSEDGSLRRWHVGRTVRPRPPLTHHSPVRALAARPDGQVVVTGTERGEVQLWRTTDGAPVGPPMSHPGGVTKSVFSPDGLTIVTIGPTGPARLWGAGHASPIASLPHPTAVFDVAYAPDSKWVVTAGKDGTARRWEATTGLPIGPPMMCGSEVRCVAVQPDGRMLATGDDDGWVILWNVASGHPASWRMRHGGPVRCLAFRPDGLAIVSGSDDATARIWETHAGRRLGQPLIHQGPVLSVAFRPDGLCVATASADRTARLWGPVLGTAKGPPMEHGGSVARIAFSPDGRTVLTGSADSTARFWSADHGMPIGPPLAHKDGVEAVAFVPGGQSVMTASRDGTVLSWPVPVPAGGTVEDLAIRVQVITGLELDGGNAVRVLDHEDWRRKRASLKGRGVTPAF